MTAAEFLISHEENGIGKLINIDRYRFPPRFYHLLWESSKYVGRRTDFTANDAVQLSDIIDFNTLEEARILARTPDRQKARIPAQTKHTFLVGPHTHSSS